MEKLNSEELTKKVQDVKESKKQFLGGRKFLDNLPSIIVAAGMLTGAAIGVKAVAPEDMMLIAKVGAVMWAADLGVFASSVPALIAAGITNIIDQYRSEREASKVKAEVSANAPAEKASETPSKPKASKSQADKAMQTLMKNKQLARV